jgi:hypothetical protein
VLGRRLLVLILLAGLALFSLPATAADPLPVRNSLGLDGEAAALAPTATGWVLVGSAEDLAGSTWPISSPIGGRDGVLAALDRTGKALWLTRFGSPGEDHGFHVAVDGAGVIWVAGVTTDTASLTPSPSGETAPAIGTQVPLDPDGVAAEELESDSPDVQALLLVSFEPSGVRRSQALLTIEADSIAVPSAVLPHPQGGVDLIGTLVQSETGATRGFISRVSALGVVESTSVLGTSQTHLSGAARQSDGSLLVIGGSADRLLNKGVVGLQDGISLLFRDGQWSRLVRSGNAGSERSWSSLATSSTGFTVAGWSRGARSEAVVSSFTSAAKVRWSIRYPGEIPAQDQALIALGGTLRLAIAASSASSSLYPAWRPKGRDLLVLTLSPTTGKTTALTAIASPGSEALISAAATRAGEALILLRSDGFSPGAGLPGGVLTARISR